MSHKDTAALANDPYGSVPDSALARGFQGRPGAAVQGEAMNRTRLPAVRCIAANGAFCEHYITRRGSNEPTCQLLPSDLYSELVRKAPANKSLRCFASEENL